MRILFKLFIPIFIIILLIIGSALIWFHSPRGQIFIEQKLSQLTKEKFDIELKIRNAKLSLTHGLELDNLSFYQNNQKIADLSAINIAINIEFTPSLLMLWKITIPKAKIRQINLLQIPILKDGKKSSNSKKTQPIGPQIKVKNLIIEEILISPNISTEMENSKISLTSSLSFNFSEMNLKFILDGSISANNEYIDKLNIYLDGNFLVDKNKLILGIHNLKSNYLELSGATNLDLSKNTIKSDTYYKSTILQKSKLNYLDSSIIEGDLNINGDLKQLIIKNIGKISYINKEQTEISKETTAYSIAIISRDNIGSGKFNINHGSLNADGDIKYKDNLLSLNNLLFAGVNFTSQTNISYDFSRQIINGQITYQDDSLEEIAKFVPGIKQGKAKLTANFSGDKDNAQRLKMNISLSELATIYGNVQSVSLDIDSPAINQWRFDKFKFLMQYLSINEFVLKKAEINAKSRNDFIDFSSSFLSRYPCQVKIKSKGSLAFKDDVKLQIADITGNIGQSKIKLVTPINLDFGQNIKLGDAKLNIGDGYLKMRGDITNNNIDSFITINNISSKLCEKIITSKHDNIRLNGTLKINGKLNRPNLDTDFNIKDIVSNDNLKNTNLSFKANITEQKLNLNAYINSDLGNTAYLKAINQVEFSLYPFKFNLKQNTPFSLALSLDDKINIFSLLPKFEGQKIEGHLGGKINVTGSISSPIIKGKLKLDRGKYVFKQRGVKVKEISADIIPKENKLIFSNIIAEDPLGNRAFGKGSLEVKTLAHKFDLTTEKFQFISNLYLTGFLSGNVKYKGNSESGLLMGSVKLDPLTITIPEQFNENIPQLNIIELVDDGTWQTAKNSGSIYDINLDLKISTGERVYVKGMGVNSRLKGELKLTGEMDDPIINGTLKSVDGKFQEFGKTLNVQKSQLFFKGPIMPSPYLNIVGVTNVEGVEIRVLLSGSIANPLINIDSSPALPKEKALSLLLFGTQTENISGTQAIQLASSARRLTGKSGGFNPLSAGKKALKIDDLNIKESGEGSGSYSVQLGKYLTDKLYFELEQGENTKARVEYQITPKISAEASTEAGDNNFGITWQKSY